MHFSRIIPRFIRRRIIFEPWAIRAPGVFELFLGRLGLGVELVSCDEDGWRMLMVHVLPLQAFIRLPLPGRGRESEARWGGCAHFERDMRNVMLYWGARVWIWDFPFATHVHQSTEVQRPDGSWAPFVGSWEEKQPGNEAMAAWRGKPLKDPDGRHTETLPYRYVLASGDVQNIMALCHVERMAWRRKWLTWTRLSEWSRQTLEISFSGEVGERAESWKGGCTGCSWAMLPNETIEEALRRMEAERKFT